MENNHTDVGQFRDTPPRRPEQTRPPEKPKRQERISITEWMAQTIDEMKRRIGWFKENPEVTRIRRLTAGQPDLKRDVDHRLVKVERKADEALAEARQELEQVIEGPTPIEEIKAERYLTPVTVDLKDNEAWQDFKYQLIKEFDQSFSSGVTREGDFEVTLSATLSTTTLKEMSEKGPQPARVRSESLAGVRVDAIMTPPDSTTIDEYRIYGLDGSFKSIPGNQDPVESLIDQARTNQINFINWQKAEEKAKALKKYEIPYTLKELVKKRGVALGSPEEYARTMERMFKMTGTKGRAEPAVGKLKQTLRPEPAVRIGDPGEWYGTEPEIEPVVDRFSQDMSAKYGKEIASRLLESMFANQNLFDQYFRGWETATHNDTLKPEQLELTRKVFTAVGAEGKKRGLAGKGSYPYLIEAYKNQENNLPALIESIETVKEIIADPTTPEADLAAYKKEQNYLYHLKTRVEQSPKRTLHNRVEKFLEQNQYRMTLGELRQIMEADQALDTADDVEQARDKVAEAMDYPARLVLDKKIAGFLKEYERHMYPGEKAAFEGKKLALETHSEPINYWDENVEIENASSRIRGRAWDRVAVESYTRVNDALKRFGNDMDEEAYPVINKLRSTLQNSLPTEPQAGLNLSAMQDIMRNFTPAEFEKYVTMVLHSATSKDMRPAWEKTDEELKQSIPESPKNETWIQEIPPMPTPKETRAGKTMVPERPTEVMAEYEEDEEYEDVSAEIPGLVRALRSVQGSVEDGRLAANRAKEILEQAGSEEMIEVTKPMLERLDSMRSSSYINERVYRKALANLINADSFNAREQIIADLKVELPLPMMHQPGKLRMPVSEEMPQEKKPGKQEVA